MHLNHDKLVYLDLDFIARKYEELKGEDPAAKTTRTEGANAGIKAYFANAGVSVTESVSYSITSRQMLSAVWQELQTTYPDFGAFENYKGTKLLWLSGKLTLAEWKDRKSEKPGYEFYELHHGTERMAFLPNNHRTYANV